MARAEARTRAVEKVIPDGVALHLSQDEAETLAGILSRIGGPFTGRRGHAHNIADALSEAGVRKADFKTYAGFGAHGSAIYIADDE